MATAKETKPATNENMRFYVQVQDTPQEARKTIGAGRLKGFTDINAMWRIKKLTEMFGPAGIGWWTQNEQFELIPVPDSKETACFCKLELVYVDPVTKEPSHPVTGVGGNKFIMIESKGPYCNDEAYKMAYTDALSIACKALGFSSDIYFSNDRSKYSLAEDEMRNGGPDLAATIKEVHSTVMQMTSKMTDDQKNELAKKIENKIGMVDYRKCKDVVALTDLLNELKKAS